MSTSFIAAPHNKSLYERTSGGYAVRRHLEKLGARRESLK
jgi:hypothetical protein